MFDPLSLGVLGGINLGLGALKSAQAAKQRKQEMLSKAAEIEASPWTGRGPTTQVTTGRLNPWAEMAGGALNAIGQAAALEKAGLIGSDNSSNQLSNNLSMEGEAMSPQAQQAADFFNQESPFKKSMWGQMSPTLYAKR